MYEPEDKIEILIRVLEKMEVSRGSDGEFFRTFGYISSLSLNETNKRANLFRHQF